MPPYIETSNMRRKYFVDKTETGYQPAYQDGDFITRYFYSQHPGTAIVDVYTTEEEATLELEKRVEEDRLRPVVVFVGLHGYVKEGSGK